LGYPAFQAFLDCAGQMLMGRYIPHTAPKIASEQAERVSAIVRNPPKMEWRMTAPITELEIDTLEYSTIGKVKEAEADKVFAIAPLGDFIGWRIVKAVCVREFASHGSRRK